uniref:DUF38 domain-containing protein n=1 Tax=Panagrolaimus sp. ES5 TaxID=591445 RepID=A0AC34GAE8_9BILA
YRDEEYTIFRKFELFNLFGHNLLASVEKITCFRNYPKDLPLFKDVKTLKELTADAFYILTYSKSFSHIEFIERVELQTNVRDLMDIDKLPFPCNELCLKDYGFSRFMTTKLKKLTNLTHDFAAKTSKNLAFIQKLTIEDYIDDMDIPNLNFRQIASCFSSKFQNLQSFTVIFIVFLRDKLHAADQFTEEFVQALTADFPNIEFIINFELYLSNKKTTHVDFYDRIIQNQNYQVNQEEKTARRIISYGNCTMDIMFSIE